MDTVFSRCVSYDPNGRKLNLIMMQNRSSYHAFCDAPIDLEPIPNLTAERTGQSSSSYNHNHERTILDLKAKVQWFHHAIAQYHGRLNELQPHINRILPRELLAIVFKENMLLCTPAGYHENAEMSYDYTPYAWLKLAHVCRHWRSIVLGHSWLFRYIHLRGALHSVELIGEWLAHSSEAPLYFVGTLKREDPSWNTILPHLSHTVHVDIVLSPTSDPEENITWPVCPLMKSVCCTVAVDEDEEQTIPYRLEKFLNCPPNLEKLTIDLAKSSVKWNALNLPSPLKRFSILSWKPQEANDLKDLVSVLRTLPCLEVLEIESAAVPAPVTPLDIPDTAVIIPSLRTLRLSGMTELMWFILQSISCLHGFHLTVQSISGLPQLLNSNEYVQPLFESLLGVKLHLYRNPETGNHAIRFEGWSADVLEGAEPNAKDAYQTSPSLSISIEEEDHIQAIETVEILCHAIYPLLRRLEWMKIVLDEEHFDGDDQEIMISVCRQLKSLRRLHVSADHSLLFAFLKVFSSRHDDFIFPQLQSLRIICFHNEGFKVSHLLRIRDALRIRARKAVEPLEELILESAEPREDWFDLERREELELVKDMVGKVQLVDTENSDSGSDSN